MGGVRCGLWFVVCGLSAGLAFASLTSLCTTPPSDFFSTRSYAFVHFTYRGVRSSFNIFFSHFIEQKFKTVPSILTYIVPVPGSIAYLQKEHLAIFNYPFRQNR